ncbi:MAG: flagellar assembly protein T N-terminal domain-containing protein, partial [candidate division KSB1 bacterium]|nr:flagellar assembly protein T N-terminal domain-containing protein [candidate division KSB1 bacterium]
MKAIKINSRLGLRVTLLVALGFWCFASGNTYALGQVATQQITATGTGTIYGGDVALARDQAIDNALRRAVEQAMGTWVQSEVVVQNYMVVEDNILNWSSGYVRNYQIVSEYQKTPELYEVTLQAEVEMADLMKDMDAVKSLLAKAGNPRIMIIMNEQNIGESYDQYHFFNVDMTVAETAMMQTFMDKGFEVVDPATVRANIKRAQALAALEGDNKAAAAIGQSFEAEVVIT